MMAAPDPIDAPRLTTIFSIVHAPDSVPETLG
jgi:hypothetical protein